MRRVFNAILEGVLKSEIGIIFIYICNLMEKAVPSLKV